VLEYLKYAAIIVVGFILICLIFLAVRSADFFFFKLYDVAVCDVVRTDYIAGFNGYRDYVTVLTGLLTLIIGATSIGAFLSFKKFRAAEQKVLDNLKEEKDTFIERRKQLEMFLKIEEARVVKDTDDKGSLAIVSLLNEAEALHDKFPLLNVLRGEEYYLIGDGYYQAAQSDFLEAIKKDKRSSRAWYGLAQVKFRLALKVVSTEHNNGNLDYDRVKEFRLAKSQFVSNDDMMISEALSDMQKSIGFGFDEESARFEMGRMYEALGDNRNALTQYQKAFRKTGTDLRIGLYYCSSWIRNNIDKLEQKNLEEIISILNRIGVLAVYNSKLAYALLWFLYSLFPNLGDAKEALNETRPYAIEEIFVMPTDV